MMLSAYRRQQGRAAPSANLEDPFKPVPTSIVWIGHIARSVSPGLIITHQGKALMVTLRRRDCLKRLEVLTIHRDHVIKSLKVPDDELSGVANELHAMTRSRTRRPTIR